MYLLEAIRPAVTTTFNLVLPHLSLLSLLLNLRLSVSSRTNRPYLLLLWWMLRNVVFCEKEEASLCEIHLGDKRIVSANENKTERFEAREIR